MPSTRTHRLTVFRRRRHRDQSGRGYTFSYEFHKKQWGSISPTLGGGRRERQVFGPRIQFEMNAVGILHPFSDVRVTDRIQLHDDTYEVLAVVNSFYRERRKFAALKSVVDLEDQEVEAS